jgi:hypothetical protein
MRTTPPLDAGQRSDGVRNLLIQVEDPAGRGRAARRVDGHHDDAIGVKSERGGG